MYKIIRFYSKEGKRPKLIKRVSTLEIAKLHCNDSRTQKYGKWFDGYQKV
jgi:hypothetical protein